MAQSPLLAMVDQAVGVYGTAPTCYLSSLARLPGVAIDDFDRAVEVDRSLVRVRAMRGSVHTLPCALAEVALAATGQEVARVNRTYAKRLGAEYDSLATQVEDSLVAGPLLASEIRAAVDPDKRLGPLFAALLARMAAEWRIVRATSSGGWRSDRLRYARWADWVPDVRPESLDPMAAKRLLAERYVAAYGPVSIDDLAWWAGWSKRDARTAADGLDLDAEGSAAAQLPGVRLLPVWDVLLVAYKHRERLLDPTVAQFVYDRFGNATSVVYESGRLVGVWDLGRSDDPLAVRVATFGTWRPDRWDAVGAEAERIGAMIGSTSVAIERIAHPVDLHTAPRNRFLSPLSARDD